MGPKEGLSSFSSSLYKWVIITGSHMHFEGDGTKEILKY